MVTTPESKPIFIFFYFQDFQIQEQPCPVKYIEKKKFQSVEK